MIGVINLLDSTKKWLLEITISVENVSGGRTEKSILYHYLVTQSSHQTIIEINQQPKGRMKIDKEQNLYAIHKVPILDVHESYKITTKIVIEARDIDFPFNASKIDEIPKSLVQSNCKPLKYWEFDDERVQNIAKKLLERSDSSVYSYLLNVFRYTWHKIKIRNLMKDRLGVLGVLESYEGDCDEFSDLFISLARAVKIPARRVVGLSLHETDDKVSFMYHAWAEAFVPGVGWVSFDPALKKFASLTKFHIARCRMGTVSQRSLLTLKYKIRKYDNIFNLNEDILVLRL